MTHYDVIIIGTGAGGGTLAYQLAPVGQADPAARARRLRPAREGQLELARRERRGEVPHAARSGTTRTASRSTRTPTTTSAATPSSTARRCSGCARRTSASSGITAACRRRGRSPTTTSSRTTRRPSTSIRSTASAASIRPSPGRARRTGFRPCSTSRASSSCTTTCRAAACGPSTSRSASCWTRSDPQTEPLHPLRHLRRLSRAWSTPRATRRSSASIRRSTHPNVTLLTNAKVDAPRDERVGPRGHRRRRRAPRRRGRCSRPTSSSSSCGAINSAALLLRSANDRHPARARQRLGRRRPSLHGPHQLGAAGDLEDAEPDRVPEDAGGQRLLLRRRRLPLSDGPHLVRRQAGRDRAVRRRAADRARHDARPHGEALARLLADVGGSARSRQSRHARSRRQHRPVLHAEQRRGPQAADQASWRICCSTSTCTRIWCRGTCSSAIAFRSPASRTRTAPIRFGRDPKTSALDANCKAHDVDNLYVVDGSFFPSSGAVNPALTIMANALRVGDHILERLGARAARADGGQRMSARSRTARCVAARAAASLRRCSACRAVADALGGQRRAAAGHGGRRRRHDRVRHGPRARVLHGGAAVREGVGRRAVRPRVRAADRRLRRAQPRRPAAARRRRRSS